MFRLNLEKGSSMDIRSFKNYPQKDQSDPQVA